MKGAIHLLFALLLFGCTEKQDTDDTGKPSIFVSIQPQAGLAKAIAGDLAEVHTLVGEGQSPHAYEPTARQLAKLGEADVLLTIGVPFEQHLLKKIVPLYPDLPVIGTHEGLYLIPMSHEHHGEQCNHDHGAMDPHVWLAPANALAIARRITEVLEQTDPVHAATYRDNFKVLAIELKELNAAIRDSLAPYKGSHFYVFHPSFGYFADAYGLKQIPIELDGKSPSPRQLVALTKQAQTDGVKIIFVQKQFPTDSAAVIAKDIGGSVVQLDPLSEDVVANLRIIAQSIEKALVNR